MNTYLKNIYIIAFCGLLLTVTYSCSSQKDTSVNRKLQNLSARYNLIYNANVLLEEYEEGLSQNSVNDFNNFLPLYYAPEIADAATAGVKIKELDDIDDKARTVIAEKNFSNYIDEAYLLLGKTNFYQGKYYNATAYFDYVSAAYKKNHNIYLNALNLKARSAIALNELKIAAKTLDTIKIELDSVKKLKAQPLATLAQFSILTGDNVAAISFLEKALKANPSGSYKTRWTYTLAQLYESEKDFEKSLAAYQKVEKSSASFEMYFNAKLSKIRLNELFDGKNFDRKLQLTKMLRDDKNADFKDQIYYEIAEDYFVNENYTKADEFYNLSVKNSTLNKVQKAFSYLKIADLNFTKYNDYVTAKLYYDSTVLVLPKTHPLYASIDTKAKNLAYLKDRFEIINLQDTLQKIALLPVTQRPFALDNYFAAREVVATENTDRNEGSGATGRTTSTYRPQAGGTFYFSNTNAISQGFNEFKKRWGNRKLANNWRQSVKSGDQIPQELVDLSNTGFGNMPSNPDEVAVEKQDPSSKSKLYLDSIPLTPGLLEQSNQKIIDAYLDMGSFYQQVLKDKPETIKTYETLLKRFPNTGKLDLVYYSLYLAYQGINQKKSDEYRALVLQNYPNSLFAKTIIDPNFSVKQNKLEAVLNKDYENLFKDLQSKDFKSVISGVNDVNKRFPGNAMEAQFDYLKAIAIGRTENVDQLILVFKNIIDKHKKEKLINPLVAQHLVYINANLNDFKKRKIALSYYDFNEAAVGERNNSTVNFKEPIIANLQNPSGNKVIKQMAKLEEKAVVAKTDVKKVEEKKPEEKKVAALVQKDTVAVKQPTVAAKVETVVAQAKIEKKDSVFIAPLAVKKDSVVIAALPKKEVKADPIVVTKPKDTVVAVKPAPKPLPVKDDLFNPASSANYYYVVAVNTNTTSVSSSRFGIGQFNRGNYSGSNLRHQLKELEKDQLIIVSEFNSVAEVSKYQESIKQQLGVIMKLPAVNYTTFAISKENLDKITNRDTLERYIRYISNNEL